MKILRVWTGPVRSEKSTRALRHANRLLRRGVRLPYVIRPIDSVRDHEKDSLGNPGGFLITQGSGEKFPSLDMERAGEILDRIDDRWDHVWIDEPMLFPDESLVWAIVQQLRERLDVMVSGCAATSEVEPFGYSLPKLLAVADHVEYCKADCDYCGRMHSATRSVCLVHKEGQVKVGGAESYMPACPTCWEKVSAAD